MANKLAGYMTAVQTAEALGVSRAAVSKACREARLEGAVLIGDVWLIPRTAVNAWKKRRAKAAG